MDAYAHNVIWLFPVSTPDLNIHTGKMKFTLDKMSNQTT